MKKQIKKSYVNYFHIFAVPWCCILPVAVAFFGFAGGALGAFLMKLTPYLLGISILLIGFANYNVWLGKFRTINHRVYVSLITLLSIGLWIWSFFRMDWI